MLKLIRNLSLALGALAVFLPQYIALVTAFKTETELGHSASYALPRNFLNFDNFILVFKEGNILLGFYNICFIIILALIGNIMIGTMAAYVLGRFNFRFRMLILGAFALSIIIPSITTQVATFGIIHKLHLFNTPYAMILLNLGTDVIQIGVYLQFIRNIPHELDESAIVEGASLFKIYRSIIFPLLAPATVTLIILKTIGMYNDLYTPYLYMPSLKLPVISTAIIRFTYGMNTSWTAISAAVIIVILPSVCLYLFLQKYIFAGITDGAVKA